MVKNRIVLAAVLVATFGEVFASETRSGETAGAAVAAANATEAAAARISSMPVYPGYVNSRNAGIVALLAASALDAYEGNAVVDFNVKGDNKFVKVGALQAALKLAPASKGLFERVTKNELSVSANFLGEAKVQVTTGQLGLAATAYAVVNYALPLISRRA